MTRFLAMAFALCLSCSASAEPLVPGISGEAKPWRGEFRAADTDDFTFVIHADLSGGERPGIFTVAARQMALLRPEFVISVGDLIEGGGDRDELIAEWDSFDERAALIEAPIFYVGGNHDLSSDLEREVWSERYGPHYYHFRFKDVLFLVLDTEDMTSERRQIIASQRAEAVEIYKTKGPEAFAQTPYAKSPERSTGAISVAQGDHFVHAIAANVDVRHTFLFVHKPAWDAEGSEFHRLEAALSDRPYTVFNGHVHVYEHRERNGRDYIQLATTGGEQFPQLGLSEDHITLVSVQGDDVEIATLMLQGIRDRRGLFPGTAGTPCFTFGRCK